MSPKAPGVESASRAAAGFNASLAALADALAGDNLVVTRLHADWGSFGGFELWVESGAERDAYEPTVLKGSRYPVPAPRVLRFVWDGRDACLSVASARPERGDVPSHWQREPQRPADTLAEALDLVQTIARERLLEGRSPE